MINSLYKAHSISALINMFEHKEKCAPQKKIAQMTLKVENCLLSPLTIRHETYLFHTTGKHPCLESTYRRAAKEGHEGRCNAIGIAVTSVDDIFKNPKLRGTATRICQQIPRNNKLSQEKDPAITQRGKKFIETLLEHKTPLDNKTYIAALGIGYFLKKHKFDPPMTDSFAHVWQEREQLLNQMTVAKPTDYSQRQK